MVKRWLTVPRRQYYERTNSLVQQYIYIDRLLDSSLPHDLLNEYNNTPGSGSSPSHSWNVEIPPTIAEESRSQSFERGESSTGLGENLNGTLSKKVKRTPREIYKVSNDTTPLLTFEDASDNEEHEGPKPEIPGMEDDSVESGDRIVQVAIYVNLVANAILLIGKIAVIVLTSSLSVLASLVDAALDFLSTAIVWTTTRMIEHQDQYLYPVGRRRLEPIGVLVFSIIMVTSFFQVALECFSRLNSGDHSIIQLGLPAIIIMSTTVFIKALCWLWCRLIKNSSVQALAQDAATDVVFNIFSIIFPLGKRDCPNRTCFRFTNNTNSGVLRPAMVARCTRWSSSLPFCDLQLGWNICWTYPESYWSGSNSRREKCPSLPHHAFRQDDQANPRLTGLSFWRQAQCRSGHCS